MITNSSNQPQERICPKCKHPAEPNEQFCRKCGHKLGIAQEAFREQRMLDEMVFGTPPKQEGEGFYYQHAIRERTPADPRLPRTGNNLVAPEIPDFRYASTISRVVAYLIDDLLILLAAYFVVQLIDPFHLDLLADYNSFTDSQSTQLSQDLSTYFSFLLFMKTLFGIIYFFICESSRYGQTLGMYLVRIKIVDYRFNRPPQNQQILLVVLAKAMELILIMDIATGRSTRNMPANVTLPAGLIKNQIRLSQKLAHIAVILK